MTDVHVRRSGDDYAEAFANELPTGPAWPRDVDSVPMRVVSGLMQIWGDLDARAADLLETEADPRATIEMLSDWERAFGLPDPCVAEPVTIVDRHKALVNRMTALGSQSRAFFIGVAAALGYPITITEFSPVMCGVSRCGDTRSRAPADPGDTGYRWQIGPPEMRFYWRVKIVGAKVRWFRAGSGRCGVDPMVRIGLATDLECLFRRWKPAHTDIVFDYSNTTPVYNTYNWFRAGVSHAGIDPMLVVVPHGGIADT